MDNGTMVEVFKLLNYSQLAKSSLVSKRFCILVQTHRQSLALLYVEYISIHSVIATASVKIFDKELSTEAYSEWVIRSNYSKQVSLEEQVAILQSTQNNTNDYELVARAHYNDSNNREWSDAAYVFYAIAGLNHENSPLFQHFGRLITALFIYIHSMSLTPQNDILHLLTAAKIINCSRLQCEELYFEMYWYSQKFLTWANSHVRCNEFHIYGAHDVNEDEAVFDFIVTGGHCTSEANVTCFDGSKAMVNFIQMFMELKNWEEYKGVQSIEISLFVKDQHIPVLKKDFAKYSVKEEKRENDNNTEHVFEFTNNTIGKKLQLTVTIFNTRLDYDLSADSPGFSLTIKNL